MLQVVSRLEGVAKELLKDQEEEAAAATAAKAEVAKEEAAAADAADAKAQKKQHDAEQADKAAAIAAAAAAAPPMAAVAAAATLGSVDQTCASCQETLGRYGSTVGRGGLAKALASAAAAATTGAPEAAGAVAAAAEQTGACPHHHFEVLIENEDNDETARAVALTFEQLEGLGGAVSMSAPSAVHMEQVGQLLKAINAGMQGSVTAGGGGGGGGGGLVAAADGGVDAAVAPAEAVQAALAVQAAPATGRRSAEEAAAAAVAAAQQQPWRMGSTSNRFSRRSWPIGTGEGEGLSPRFQEGAGSGGELGTNASAPICIARALSTRRRTGAEPIVLMQPNMPSSPFRGDDAAAAAAGFEGIAGTPPDGGAAGSVVGGGGAGHPTGPHAPAPAPPGWFVAPAESFKQGGLWLGRSVSKGAGGMAAPEGVELYAEELPALGDAGGSGDPFAGGAVPQFREVQGSKLQAVQGVGGAGGSVGCSAGVTPRVGDEGGGEAAAARALRRATTVKRLGHDMLAAAAVLSKALSAFSAASESLPLTGGIAATAGTAAAPGATANGGCPVGGPSTNSNSSGNSGGAGGPPSAQQLLTQDLVRAARGLSEALAAILPSAEALAGEQVDPVAASAATEAAERLGRALAAPGGGGVTWAAPAAPDGLTRRRSSDGIGWSISRQNTAGLRVGSGLGIRPESFVGGGALRPIASGLELAAAAQDESFTAGSAPGMGGSFVQMSGSFSSEGEGAAGGGGEGGGVQLLRMPSRRRSVEVPKAGGLTEALHGQGQQQQQQQLGSNWPGPAYQG